MFSLAAIVFSPERAHSQALPFQSYNAKDGLVSNNAVRLYQDSEGFLWIGTSEGVSSFDGQSFVNYTSTDGLPHSTVRQILEEKWIGNKSILVLTYSGDLSRIKQGKVWRVPVRAITGTWKKILTLGLDHTGAMWAGTDDGVAYLINDTLHPIVTGLRMQYVSMILEEADSIVWIACRHSLIYYIHRTKEFKEMDLRAYSPFEVNDAAIDHEGNVWIILKGGSILQIRNRKVMRRLTTARELGFLAPDRDGYLWFGSYEGLSRLRIDMLSEPAVEHFTVASGLPDNVLKHALVDKEGNLWIAGLKEGIARLSEKNIYHIALEGINPPYHLSIGASDTNDRIWAVSRMGLWEIWRDSSRRWRKSIHHIAQGNGSALPYNVFDIGNNTTTKPRPYSVVCDSAGRLWIGFSNAQIACYRVRSESDNPSRLDLLHVLRPNVDFPSAFPKCFIVDKSGMVWYSIGDNRILLLDPNKQPALVRTFGSLFGLPTGNYARALLQDRHGNIWAGSFTNGIARLDADSIRSGAFQQVFPERSITSIMQGRDGRIWFGTHFRGLAIVAGDSLLIRSRADGLPSDNVFTLTEDAHGRIWIGTQAGAAYLDSANAQFIHRPIELSGFSTFCSGMTRNGILWFVTDDGVTLHNATQRLTYYPTPPALITSLSVNGRDTTWRDGLELSYRRNSLTVRFVAITFRDGQDIAYQYRLRNLTDQWQPPSTSRSVTFAELPPGEYQFEVRALRGTNRSKPTAFTFSITPPFWATWWFRVFAFVGVLVSVGGTIRYVEKRKLMRRIEQLEQERALERERARISQDMHDEVGSSLSEIAILSELAKQKPEEAGNRVQEISERASEVIDNVSEIVWAMNPKNDTLDNLIAHLRRYAVRYLNLAQIKCTFTAPDDIPAHRLTAEVRRNLFLVVKEALHNVVKHACASEVLIAVRLHDAELEVFIKDNGKGFVIEENRGIGNGLAGMAKRVSDVGGIFKVESKPNEGTMIEICLPNSKY